MASFDYMAWVDRNWSLLNHLMAGHTAIYRATNGMIGSWLPGGLPILLLDHVGAKSGRRRTNPLLYATDGDDLVLVASKGGHPKNPAWFHNLMANPDTTVQVGSERRSVHARQASADERERLWERAVAVYGPYESYRRRTGREIPIVILERSV
jgi:deazaflavin-dependent oxidoreductase (nitroreductase family)